jgi:Na+/melibiose symporter-like transporter
VLPEAERRAWSRRHPVRVSLGRSLLVTPFVAVVVVLAPGVSWGLRVVGIVLAALVVFVVSWCAMRVRADRTDEVAADF